MKALRIGQSAAVLSIAALALTACGGSNTPAASSSAAGGSSAAGSSATSTLTGTLTGGGASSQEAAMTAWADGFTAANPGVKVQYNPVGSGAGRKGFLAGQYQFAGSDSAMKEDEQTEAQKICGPDGAVQVPAYVSPIAVAFNLPGVERVNMDADTIASVFTKKITKWNDPKIAEQNEGVELPDTAITVVHRSDESGTTKNFQDYLSAAAPKVWTYGVEEKWPSDIQAENAQGTSGVVGLATKTEGSIVYADASQIGKLGTVAVKVGDKYEAYTPEAAAKTVETSKKVSTNEHDLAIKLDRTSTTAGTYPIVLVSYHIFCATYKDQETVDLIKAFGKYAVSAEGQKVASESAGNAPLTDATIEEANKAIDFISVAK